MATPDGAIAGSMTPGAPPPAPGSGASLEDRLAVIKAEVDALQIALHSDRGAWYRNSAVVVSVLALVFSVATTIFSWSRDSASQEHAKYLAFRQVVDELVGLPLQQLELANGLADVPGGLDDLDSAISRKEALLANRAIQYLRDGGTARDAREHLEVADALRGPGKRAQARELYVIAARVADDPSDLTAALRGLAAISFESNQPVEARRSFRAVTPTLRKRFPSLREHEVDLSATATLLSWARAEARDGNCAKAWRLVLNANRRAARTLNETLRADVADLRRRLTEHCGLFAGPTTIGPPTLPTGAAHALSDLGDPAAVLGEAASRQDHPRPTASHP